MWVTNDQAAEIYARFCKARYGSEAMKVIKTRVAELRKLGDKDGERIWNLSCRACIRLHDHVMTHGLACCGQPTPNCARSIWGHSEHVACTRYAGILDSLVTRPGSVT